MTTQTPPQPDISLKDFAKDMTETCEYGSLEYRLADFYLKNTEPSITPLSVDDAETELFLAIKAIIIGNRDDDKLILENLKRAGIWLYRFKETPDRADKPADNGGDAYDWNAAIVEIESWLVTDLIPEPHLKAAIAALREMSRRENKKSTIKEIMKL